MKKFIVIAIIISFIATGFAAVSASAEPAHVEAQTTTYTPGYSSTEITVLTTSGPQAGE